MKLDPSRTMIDSEAGPLFWNECSHCKKPFHPMRMSEGYIIWCMSCNVLICFQCWLNDNGDHRPNHHSTCGDILRDIIFK